MKKILVWDIPARLFHWAFAGSLTAAIAIGFLVDDDAPLFQLHMLFGIVALFLLGVRVVMGMPARATRGSPVFRCIRVKSSAT